MAFFLVPISIFIKEYLSLPVSYLNTFIFYVYLLFILMSFIKGVKKTSLNELINWRGVAFFFILITFQFIAMLSSYADIGDSVMNRNPYKTIVVFILYILCIYIHFIVVKFSLTTINDISKFLRGIGVTLFIIITVSTIQLLYLTVSEGLAPLVSFIGNYFEYRWLGRDFYIEGSYVQTVKRVNGFSPEAGFFAAQLLIAFIPFIMSAIKNKVNIFFYKRKYSALLYYTLLISIIIILFSAQTTTGMVAIGIIFFALILTLPFKQKVFFVFLFSIFLAIMYHLYQSNIFIQETLDNYIFDKEGTSNRSGGTIGLIKTWLQHPLIGIGNSYHNYYLMKNVPIESTLNSEFIEIYVAQNFYPILSLLFGWLAEFGGVILLIISIYLIKLLKDYKLYTYRYSVLSRFSKKSEFLMSLKDSCYYFVGFYFLMSILNWFWDASILLIIFFFFVVVRQFLNRELQKVDIGKIDLKQ